MGDAVEVEVEVLLVIVDLDEVLSSEGRCVLDVLPDHPLVVGLVDRLGFSGAQQTVVEQVGRRLHVGEIAHDLVVGVARDDGVEDVKSRQRYRHVALVAVAEAERHAHGLSKVEGEELRQGAMAHHHAASRDGDAVDGSIGDLRVVEVELAPHGIEAIALAVVHRTVIEAEFGAVGRGGVADDAVVGRVEVGILDLVVERRGVEPYALPLSRDAVVGQVVEHAVDTVAAQRDVGLGRSLGAQRAIDVDASMVGEVECRARSDGERGGAIHLYVSFNHDGFCALYQRVTTYL